MKYQKLVLSGLGIIIALLSELIYKSGVPAVAERRQEAIDEWHKQLVEFYEESAKR